MKNFAISIALLSALIACSQMQEDEMSSSQYALDINLVPCAQEMLSVQIKGTSLFGLPLLLEEHGFELEVSTAFPNRKLDVDSEGKPLGQVLEEVAASVGGYVTYEAPTFRIAPIISRGDSPLPEMDSEDQPVLRGALAREDIRRVIHTYRASIRSCYENAIRSGHDDLEGKVTVVFEIDSTGVVNSAEVDLDASTLTETYLTSCLLDVVESMVFPEPRGGGVVIVTYPFVFKR